MPLFDDYLKEKIAEYNKNKGFVGGGGSAGALEPEPYQPINFDEYLEAPSSEAMSQIQDTINALEKDYEILTPSIETDYELYKDYTKQLDDLEIEMQEAADDMQFFLNQKYNDIREKHNIVVERLQGNTKKQEQIIEEYNKLRPEYEKDIEIYNRKANAQNKKEAETREALKETKDPTWGQMIFHTFRAGLNEANSRFYNVLRMVEMGKIDVEKKIEKMFFPGTEDREKKFKEKYGEDTFFSLPLDIITDLTVDAEQKATESAEQAESKAWLKQSMNIGLRPIPQIVMSGMAGFAIPFTPLSQLPLSGGAKLTAEFLKNWLRMSPFGLGAGAGKAREIEKDAERLNEEAPYMKMLLGMTLSGLGEMATEMPVFLGVMKVLKHYGAGTLINQSAKTVIGKYGKLISGAFSNIFLQGFQEGEMYVIGKAIDEFMGDPQDWSKEDLLAGTWRDFYGGLMMAFCMLGMGGGFGASASIATKSKRAFNRFIKDEDDLQTTLRKILEYQGIVMEEPEIEALAYRLEEEEGKETPDEKEAREAEEYKTYQEPNYEILKEGQVLIDKSGAKWDITKVTKGRVPAKNKYEIKRQDMDLTMTKALGEIERYYKIKEVEPTKPLLHLEDVTKDIAELHKKNKGATYNLYEGNMAGKEKFSVAVFPEREMKVEGKLVSPERLKGFIKKNMDILKDPKYNVGLWYSEKSKKTHIDISLTVDTLEEAYRIGEEKKQEKIYDLKADKVIPVLKVGVKAIKVGEVYTGKAYRGESKLAEHGADVIAKMKTAQEKMDYDYGTTGNVMFKDAEKVAKGLGIDLGKVANKDMMWIAPELKTAEQYGEAKEIKMPKDTIVLADDKKGGYLVIKNADKYMKVAPKALKIDDVWDKNKDSLMSGKKLSDIAKDPSIIKGTEDFKTVTYWIDKYRKEGTKDTDIFSRDKTGQLYDGYHRLVAAKHVGIEKITVEDFTSEMDFLDAEALRTEAKPLAITKTYEEGVKQAEGKKVNIRVNQLESPKTKGKVLAIQFSTDLLQTEGDIGKEFYDKLYSGLRKGYDRLADFWEVPPWIAQITKNFGKDTEVLVVRDMEEAKAFLKDSEYDSVAFSAMDVNKDMVKELADVIPGKTSVDIGSYIEKPKEFFGEKANIHKDIESYVKAKGKKYTPGLDYSLFKDSPVVGRIMLSKGCKHHCIFCDVTPHGKTQALSNKEINQQVDAIVALKSPLVYLDDKTLGQESNYKNLPKIYKRIKDKMPDFDGFIIQTTASEMNKVKFPAKYFKDAGIRYVELGVESYNDVIQKVFRKPANTKTIDKAVDWLRQNEIHFIPNVIVGGRWTKKMADAVIKKGVTKEEKKLLLNLEETKESYQKTLDFLESNKDIISHINLYNFAAYADTTIGQELGKTKDIDVIENIIEKSFHKNQEVHIEAYKKFREFATKALDTTFEQKAKKSLEDRLKVALTEIKRLRAALKISKGNKEKRAELKKELVAYIRKNMPYDIQNKMLVTVKNVTGDKALAKAIEKVDQYTQDYYRRQYIRAIRSELKAKKIKPTKAKSGIPKGKFVPDIQDKLEIIQANVDGNRQDALAEIQKLIALANQGQVINVAEQIELLNMVGVTEMNLETLQSTLANIKSLKKEGRTLKGIKEAKEKARHEKDIIGTLKSTTGKEVEIDEETGKGKIDTGYKTIPKTKKMSWIKKSIDKIANWQYGLDNLADKLSFLDKTSKPYESDLSKIIDRVHYARTAGMSALEDVLNLIQVKFAEAFESTSVKEITKATRKLREEVDLGEFKNSEGDTIHLVLNKEQIAKKVMQLDDLTLESRFEGMLYTDEIKDALRGALSKKELAWIKGVGEIYDYMHERINPVFEDMFGIHFPRVTNYSGTARTEADVNTPEVTLMSQDVFKRASILNPSLKSRSKSKQPLKYDEMTASLMNYVMQMEHFINWARPLQDLRSVFGDKRVISVINEIYGDDVLKKVNGFLDDMTRDGVDKAKIVKWVDTIRFNFTRSILAKPHIGLKQIPSVLAYMTEMPTADFFKGVGNFWKNPIKNYKYLVEHSAYARARFGEGFERDIHGAMQSDYVHLLSHTHKISDMTMGMVRAGDKFAVMQGMWAKFYSETKGQTTKAKNAEAAIRRAEISTQRTQPSFTIESLATGQRGGSFLKLFTMFQNQPNKYFRIIADNARNFRAGRGSRVKAASNIVLAWAVLPMLFQFVGDGGKWIGKHQFRALILGVFNDLLVFGSMIRGMYGWLIKEAYDVNASPVFATLREIEYCLAKVAKWTNPDKDLTPEDIQAFTEHFAKAFGQLVGLPTPYAVQVKKAIQSKDYRQLLFSEYILNLENEEKKTKKPYVKGAKYGKYLKGKYKKPSKYGKYLKY